MHYKRKLEIKTTTVVVSDRTTYGNLQWWKKFESNSEID